MLDFLGLWNFVRGRSSYSGMQSQVYDINSPGAPPGAPGDGSGGGSCQTEESAGAERELAGETVGTTGGACQEDWGKGELGK